nr:MAG TPA: hypothetical protein [Caudoviricetes sp.]
MRRTSSFDVGLSVRCVRKGSTSRLALFVLQNRPI